MKDKIKREYFAKLFPIFSIENLPNFEILFYFILFYLFLEIFATFGGYQSMTQLLKFEKEKITNQN